MAVTGNYLLSLGILFLQVSALSCNHFKAEQLLRCPHPSICEHLGRERCSDGNVGCGPCLKSYVEEEGFCRKIYRNEADLPGNALDSIASGAATASQDGAPESCDDGFVLTDGACEDVNECKMLNSCPMDVGCINTVGSFRCVFDGANYFDGPAAPAKKGQKLELNAAAQVDRRADGGDGGDGGGGGGGNSNIAPAPADNRPRIRNGEIVLTNWQFIVIIASCVVVGVSGIAIAVLCWYKLHTTAKAASDTEYPAYGVTGPTTQRSTMTNGDRKLAQSAQMYHYQHQKQQMIALENRERGETQNDASDYDSDDNEDEPTVYECPGLAPTGEMEVKNPLFQGVEERLQEEQKHD